MDFTKCAAGDCKFEGMCWRKTNMGNPYRQSYADFSNGCVVYRRNALKDLKEELLGWNGEPIIKIITLYGRGTKGDWSIGKEIDLTSLAEELVSKGIYTNDNIYECFITGLFYTDSLNKELCEYLRENFDTGVDFSEVKRVVVSEYFYI